MLQLLTLLVLLSVIAIIITIFSRKAVISPQFGFTVCFLPGIIYSLAYIDKWDLRLSNATVGIFLTGTIVFVMISFLSEKFFSRILKRKRRHIKANIFRREKITVNKIVVIIIFQFITLLLTIYFLKRNYGSNLSLAMAAFRRYSGISDDYVALPGIIKMFRRISLSAGFISIYIFVRGIVYKNKDNRKMTLISIAAALLNGLVLGARGDAIQLVCAGVIQFFLMHSIRNGNRKIQIKSLLKVFSLVAIIILTFAEVGELMGRNMSFLKFGDYISVYLSAEIKNLDTFVRAGKFGAPFSDFQTNASISHLIAVITGNPSFEHKLTNPYRFVNGYSLGNVSTTFYGFLYDGGVFGVVIFTAIMAIICQYSFCVAIKSKPDQKIEMGIVIYSYIWYTIIFSFFSDKFYEMIFNTAFIWFVVGCYLVKILFSINIKNRGR